MFNVLFSQCCLFSLLNVNFGALISSVGEELSCRFAFDYLLFLFAGLGCYIDFDASSVFHI